MVRTRCPDCDELIEIHPTGQAQREGWSSQWWSIVLHRHPTKPEICEGSGKRV